MEDLRKNVFIYVLNKWKKVHKTEIPREQKEIVYRIGNQVLNFSDQFGDYTFNSNYNSVIRSFDLVCDRIQNGMNTPYDLNMMEKLTEDCEEIMACYEEAKELGKEINKNIKKLEKRVKKEEIEREKILEKIIINAKNQKFT